MQIPAYVPQFKIGAFQYPFIAADISNYDKTMIDWNDPSDPSYEKHNLINDFPVKGALNQDRGANDGVEVEYAKPTTPIFALVKSWSPFENKDKKTE